MDDSTEKKPVISKIELKILINKKEEKVLYAEANKEFVDFLFSLVSLPLVTVIKLLANKKIAGSIGDLYNSIKSFNQNYLESSKNLDSILNPEPPQLAFESPISLTINTGTDLGAGRKGNGVYVCPAHTLVTDYAADDPNTLCPYCKGRMTHQLQFVDRKGSTSSSGSGFVKEMVPYMVMDNLEVKPLSTISTLALFNSSNIQDLTSLEEMVVHVGAVEGLKLLEESMQSKNVLTNVFLAKRSKRRI